MELNVKTNEIYTFKLNSGEELIAKVVSFDSANYILEEPVSVAPGPQGMGLMPSLFTSEPKGIVKLNTNSVALLGNTEDNIKTKYIEATTGLKVPSKKLVLG